MYQRTNRAFYSEQLLSFPGRLHITAEKVCIEVRVKENGQLKFRSFTSEEFNELRSMLREQDFYKRDFEEAYRQELFYISERARKIKDFLFCEFRQDAPQEVQGRAVDVQLMDEAPIETSHENEFDEKGIEADLITTIYVDENDEYTDNWTTYENVIEQKSVFKKDLNNKEIPNINATNEWKRTSPAYQLVKKMLEEDKSYDEILEQIEIHKKQDHIGYSSRLGSSITKATLSNWAREMGYNNKTKVRAKEWRQNSTGYKWFSGQILAGKSQEEIIEQFNKLHEISPELYSTMMGDKMSISTFIRWRREILENKAE